MHAWKVKWMKVYCSGFRFLGAGQPKEVSKGFFLTLCKWTFDVYPGQFLERRTTTNSQADQYPDKWLHDLSQVYSVLSGRSWYTKGRQKLCSAFVDGNNAFDLVWLRAKSALVRSFGEAWYFYHFDMFSPSHVYSRRGQCAMGNNLSDRFDCPTGVRRGSVEIQIIAFLYITCLADYSVS